jgi:hypothetical protein
MLKTKFLECAREFKVNDVLTRDHGKIELSSANNKTNEFVTFQTKSGKNCDFYATYWGFYLGPSVNSRLKKEGFRTGLMMNEGNQLYVVAVEVDMMTDFEDYLEHNKSKVICWLDDWFKETEIKSPHKK